ncbi:MAG: AtpZ/AtpI family protein [Chloroflexi bacterium]|nr:MAG: hypothetical protein CUN54_03525 [Phototrophicales bacterium]RMF79425.1 MAG: AtpZ/AtpI family protein [Chloroflexota bacterium]
MNSDKDPSALYLLAIRAMAQIGCLLTLVAGGALVVGLAVDTILGTKPFGLLVLLLGSIPVSLWVIYRYTTYHAKRFQNPAPPKEEDNQWE